MISRRALVSLAAILPVTAHAQLVNPGAPTLGERDGLISPSSSSWEPSDLGASLFACWDAERSDLVTRDGGGLVSSWRDTVGGYNAVQATGANQPVWSATSFGGRPGITGDGVSDELTLAPVPAGIPTGADPCEVWVLCDQTLAAADAVLRAAVAWGAAGTNSRQVLRVSVTSVNRARVSSGDGTTQHLGNNTSVDLTGRHVVRGIFSGTTVQVDVDGVAGVPVGDIHATVTTRLRLFAAAATSAANFWQGSLSTVLITAPLTAGQAASLYTWLGNRTPDADAELWAAAVVANAGLVSNQRLLLVSNLIRAWKSAGTWPLIDDAWLLVAENVPQALTSLKQRRLAVSVNAPSFTIDRGYAFAGSSYIDTGFIPSVNAVAMTGTSLHIAAYERTNVGNSNIAAGCVNASAQNLQINPRTSGNMILVQLDSQSSGPGGDAIITDSRGLAVGSRNGTLAADILAYKNGVAVLPFAPGSLGSTRPTVKVFIGCRADPGNVPAGFRAATEGFVSVGAGIPAAQQTAFYNAIQSFMTAVGANV